MALPAEKQTTPARAPRVFTTDVYHRMIDARILTKKDRVELINGVIIEMSPIGTRHAGCVDRSNELFTRRFRKRALVRVQGPVVLGDFDEPEPDLILLRPRADFYCGDHPRPADIFLIVEVCDTSIAFDRNVKLPRYALAGISECWLVDVIHDVIEVYREPRAGTYRQTTTLGRGRRLAPLAFPRTWLRVADLLG